ncbi:MAG TPA: metallophosphoesterase, partial [Solirubrobacterales bacterium]|nr:metallophosphoesterase [Solirubrobacterales bacterium]
MAEHDRPETLEDLEFERQEMVNWFSLRVLVISALRVVLSSLFGQYADKRDFQAALDPHPGPPCSYGPADEVDGALWLDFVADLGDGFDSTYAIAGLLARPRLELSAGEGWSYELPRGRALVMGGDEVYPVATREEYENRFRGPYEMAFPESTGSAPDLFAIPGNHDWYDGLTNFLRFLCAEREIGGWQTKQSRSYFALQLPHRWWLLAIDIQLDTYIDEPQLEYFKGIGLQKGDRVILVTGKPSWLKVKPGHVPDSYKNLQYFTSEVVAAAEAEVRVTLTGDLHHYCRFRAEDGGQDLVTSGGGGAYLFPTHT